MPVPNQRWRDQCVARPMPVVEGAIYAGRQYPVDKPPTVSRVLAIDGERMQVQNAGGEPRWVNRWQFGAWAECLVALPATSE